MTSSLWYIYIYMYMRKSRFWRNLQVQSLMKNRKQRDYLIGKCFLQSTIVLCFPCTSQCIGNNWHPLMLISQKHKNMLGTQRVNDLRYSYATGIYSHKHVTLNIPYLQCLSVLESPPKHKTAATCALPLSAVITVSAKAMEHRHCEQRQ